MSADAAAAVPAVPTRRRGLVLAAIGIMLPAPRIARAHHGWGSFDESAPIYLAGPVRQVRWENPHAMLTVADVATALPADLAARSVPAQTARVDAATILAKARLSRRREQSWTIELAPLTRMQAWQIPPLRVDDRVEVIGFTSREEKGGTVLRAEFLFANGRVYGLRSSPAG